MRILLSGLEGPEIQMMIRPRGITVAGGIGRHSAVLGSHGLLSGGVLLPCLRNARLLIVAMVNQNTVAQREAFSGRDGVTAVEPGIVEKLSQAKRIDRKQTIAPCHPGGWMPQIMRVIENGNTHLFAVNISVIIHPVGLFAPDVFFTGPTV